MKRATKPRTKAERPQATAPAPGSWLHEAFLERAADPALVDSGQTSLGAFLTLRLIDRFAVGAYSTPPEALEYQTQATRDYLLDLQPQGPEEGHLLEIVRVADAVRTGGTRRLLWSPLHAYAYWLEQELRLSEALDVVDTGLRVTDTEAVSEETAAYLQRGRILRLLGQFDAAREAYEKARARAMSVGDMHSVLLGRIGDAVVMRQVGNLPASEAALRGILKDAEDLADRDAQARAHHDLGLALSYQQRSRDAIPHLHRAFELYEQAAYRLRALSDVGEALKEQGLDHAAEDAFTLVLSGGATVQMRLYALIALLELSARTRNRVAFLSHRKEIERSASGLPADLSIEYQLQLGIGYAAFGKVANAQDYLRNALAEAERKGLGQYVFRIERTLQDLASGKAQPADKTSTGGAVVSDDVIGGIAAKLGALRVAS